MKKILIIVSSVILWSACQVDDAAEVVLVELGTPVKAYNLEAEGGRLDLAIYSNSSYRVELDRDADWLSLGATSGNGDGILTVTAPMNEGFRRMAGVVLCSNLDERRDTITVRQKGLLETTLAIENTSLIGHGEGGQTITPITTNIPFEDFKVTINYYDGEGWITGVDIRDGNLSVTTDANPDPVKVRTATILFSYVDGWGVEFTLPVNFTQKNAKEILGELISFRNLFDYYTEGTIVDDILIDGIVVSNTAGGNAGENEQKTTSSIDYSGSKTTVYLEAEDGSLGVALRTASEEDNIFNQYDHVQLRLSGAGVTVYHDPERHVLTGITKSMVVSQVTGNASQVPVKEKAFKDLSDDDIYTYVSLTNVEFPIRKGSISPINEGYSIGGNADRISKFPLLVRDKDGKSFYMYTNTVCVYRNDGTRLPYGGGKLSGIIVHERFSRFDWKDGADLLDIEDDPELGNIGRYQIRHQTKEDIWAGMKDSVEDSFSALLTEYRYWNPDPEAGVQRPTYGTNGWFTHTYQVKYTGDETKDYTAKVSTDALFLENQHMLSEVAFSYLGPMGIGAQYFFGYNPGNVNGVGLVLDPEKDHYNPEMEDWVGAGPDGKEWMAGSVTDELSGIRVANGGNMSGKTWCARDCYLSFRARNWWDYDTNHGYAWMINFSTEGLFTEQLSLQISQMNTAQKFYAPRYWKAEWSTVDSMDPADDTQWHLIAQYTVPDISQWSNTLYSSIVGYKGMNFPLPLEMLGKENVYIRLLPENDTCSDGADYANTVLGTDTVDGMHDSAIEYIAIRYNK